MEEDKKNLGSRARKSNWRTLPSRRENEEELGGDYKEYRSRSQPQDGSIIGYIQTFFEDAQWKLAKKLTVNQTTHLKIKEGITPTLEDDEGRRKYQNLLFQKATLGFYGSFFAGMLGVILNVVGFGMICFGQTELGISTAAGGVGLEGSAFFIQKISQDANDRLDNYFGNGRGKDEDTEEGEG